MLVRFAHLPSLALLLVTQCGAPSDPGSPSRPDANADANATTDAASVIDGPAGAVKRIFVAPGAFTGDLYAQPGGLEAGDARCNAAAQDANLGGTWKAWLSTSQTNAIDRVGEGPWYFVDGRTIVFASRAQLSQGPSVPINRGAQGEAILAGLLVWTGTTASGVAAADTCQGWTTPTGVSGLVGQTDATGTLWTSSTVRGCGLYASLYCLEP